MSTTNAKVPRGTMKKERLLYGLTRGDRECEIVSHNTFACYSFEDGEGGSLNPHSLFLTNEAWPDIKYPLT
jgi:hypothetical protein